MQSCGTVLAIPPFVPRMAEIPLASVLAFADRKTPALVTIGRWSVVFIPGHPVDPPERRQGSLPAPGDPAVSDTAVSDPEVCDLEVCDLEVRSVQPDLDIGNASSESFEQRDPGGLAPSGPPALRTAAPSSPPQSRAILPSQWPSGNPIPSPKASDQGVEAALLRSPSPHGVERAPLGSVRGSAVSWALLSQVFWLPLLAIDVHDRWLARQRDITPPGLPLPPSPVALAAHLPLRNPFGAVGQAVRGASSGIGVLLSRAGSSATSLLDRPFSVSVDAPPAPSSGARRDTAGLPQTASPVDPGLFGRAFTRAQLLGGRLSLADLQEGPMAPLALVERALQRSSNDPLAPLPPLWREPMRQALQKLPGGPVQLDTARMVHVPSRSVSQSVEVPLALQSDGSVDILELPVNAALVAEIETWSRQQRLPASGSLLPAIVHLHPLPSAAPIAPLPTSGATPTPPAAVSGTASATASASASPAPSRPQPRQQLRQSPASGATAAPAPLPIRSEATAPAAAAALIPVPIHSEASAPLAPSAAAAEPSVAPSVAPLP